MEVNISMSYDGKIKITTGSEKVRLENVDKFLGRNDDAVLVKLKGTHDWCKYRVGHVCRIEKDDSKDQTYNVFVGKHLIGQLPDEAIDFARQVDSIPESLVSIIGEIEYGASADQDVISIYIAE